MPMQPPSAARKPELPPAKQAAAATNTITEKASGGAGDRRAGIKPCGSVLVLASFW